MSNLATYVDKFFDTLQLTEDLENGHSYKAYLRAAMGAFLNREDDDAAFEVYRMFFDSYRIAVEGERNPFIDLVDMLRSYEETAATLIDKQRDHFVHAVNVFATGLAIWAENPQLRDAFAAKVPEDGYTSSFASPNEEFFFRWGVASLFHDVGYPVEIVGHQINRFIRIIADMDGSDVKVRARISYENFGELNHIAEIVPAETFCSAYRAANDDVGELDLMAPLDLLAHSIHRSFGCDLATVKAALDGFVDTMAATGFIDHGYYSSLIVLKWYGFALQQSGGDPSRLFWPVLDAAQAIFLHNWYRNGLMKEPFSLGAMHAADNPLAFLLILCDELQEWNREAHGILTRTFTLADTVHLSLGQSYLAATFVTKHGRLPEGFCSEKEELLHRVLAVDEVFPAGIDLDAESLDSFYLLKPRLESLSARPLLKDIELLAIAIHARYNEEQVARYPDKPLSFPHFSDLPDDLKYSNMRQAQGIYDKLALAGYTMRPKGAPGAVRGFAPELVEAMARFEHDEWMKERIANGWTLGERNVERKTSPYLVPYEELSEEIKELDRDAVRNIPLLADRIGMAIYDL